MERVFLKRATCGVPGGGEQLSVLTMVAGCGTPWVQRCDPDSVIVAVGGVCRCPTHSAGLHGVTPEGSG